MRFTAFSLCLTLLLSSCYNLSDRAQPIDVPEAPFTSSENFFTPWIPDYWWTLFKDPQLDTFIETALERNPNIQIARENINLTYARMQRIRSVLYPNINWGADVSFQKLSQTGIIPFGKTGAPIQATQTQVPNALNSALPAQGGTAGIPVYFTQYETDLFLTYDFDIWGKNRNAVAAAAGEYKAKEADEAFISLQVSIGVARVYLQLQINYQRYHVAQEFVENKSKYLKLVQDLLQRNLESNIAVKAAESDLASAKQYLLNLEKEIKLNEYFLQSMLAGDFDEQINPIHVTENNLPSIPLPDEIPLHLIAHRPDIISQLWLIESADLLIEVAKAGFYPDVNIAALFGFQTIHLQDLLNWKSVYYNVDPAISLPIFDGGRLRANLRESEANYNLMIYEYNNRILNAVREVLEGITLVRNANQQYIEFKKQTSAQEEISQLVSQRFRFHLSSGLDYLISQSNVLIEKDNELIALGNRFQALLTLIKSLGGGYEACVCEG